MNPVEEVKEELIEWLLQGGVRRGQVEVGRYLDRKLRSLLQREERRKKHLSYFTKLKQDSLEEVKEWKTEMTSLSEKRVRKSL